MKIKNNLKTIFQIVGIIFVAVIGFSLAACGDGGGGTNSTTYTVTVNNGTGGGSFAAGATVTITATVPSGQTFQNWTVDSGGVTLANANSSSTTFTMPTNDVTVTANFSTTYTVTVNNGTGGGSYAEGATVTITATVPSGQVFVNWTVDSGDITLANAYSQNTTFTMPANAVTVTANFTTPVIGDGTGDIDSRRYTVEVYSITSATYTYLSDTYGSKTYEDFQRADIISKTGTSLVNSYTNQTFQNVISVYSNSIGMPSQFITATNNNLTLALQTYNRSGYCGAFGSGSTYRFHYVTRKGQDNYTVEVYNITSATYTYLSDTYSGKTYDDIKRVDIISKTGTSLVNSYTNQTFQNVILVYSNSIGMPSQFITATANNLTEALQTQNRKSFSGAFGSGSTYRFHYVSQE